MFFNRLAKLLFKNFGKWLRQDRRVLCNSSSSQDQLNYLAQMRRANRRILVVSP